MQFLKTVFWVIVAIAAVIFAMANWTPVTLNLWSGLVIVVKLPVLLLVAVLIGLLPTLLVHYTTRWRLRRRLDSAERSLAETQAASTTGAEASPEPPVLPYGP